MTRAAITLAAVQALGGCVDMASEENTAASLRDAVAQARSGQ